MHIRPIKDTRCIIRRIIRTIHIKLHTAASPNSASIRTSPGADRFKINRSLVRGRVSVRVAISNEGRVVGDSSTDYGTVAHIPSSDRLWVTFFAALVAGYVDGEVDVVRGAVACWLEW